MLITEMFHDLVEECRKVLPGFGENLALKFCSAFKRQDLVYGEFCSEIQLQRKKLSYKINIDLPCIYTYTIRIKEV